MRDAERALDVLIHDLRAPLSVAQGYLRLIRENRLAGSEDRDRAIARAMDSLGRISDLCADASAYLQPSADSGVPARAVRADDIVELVRSRLDSNNVSINIDGSLDDGRIRSGPSRDRLADAIARVVSAVLQEDGGRSADVALDITARPHELRLSIGPALARAMLGRDASPPFDPWRGGHGLALPLACRTITEAGGRIWQLPSGRGAAGIAFPMEAAGR